MLLDISGMALRNISRKKTRTLIVVLALGFSIALMTSIYTSMDATNANISSMIGAAGDSSASAIANATAGSQAMKDAANANTRDMIDAADANTSEMVNKTIQGTQDMIDSINDRTAQLIAGILEQYQDMVNQTETQMTLITVTNSTRSSSRPGGNMPPSSQSASSYIDSDTIANISAIDGVDAVVPIVQQSFGHNTTPQDPNGTSGNGTGPGDVPDGGPPGRVRVTTDYIVYGILVNDSLDGKYHFWPTDITNGSTISSANESAVLLHEDLVAFFNASVGGNITVNGTNLTVKGIYRSGLQNMSVYISLEVAENVLGIDNGSAQTLNVYATNLSLVDNVTDTIRYYFPNFTVTPFKSTASSSTEYVQRQQQAQIQRLTREAANQTAQLEASMDKQVVQLNADRDSQVAQLESALAVQVNQSESDLAGVVNRSTEDMDNQVHRLEGDMFLFRTVGNLVIGVAAISAALVIFFMMFYTVRERTREIGVFKALGFKGRSVMAMFVIEGMVIGLLGGLAGVLIAMASGRALSGLLLPAAEEYTPADPGLALAAVVLALATVLGAAGSLYPAMLASRKSAVEAMRNA
jgi:ABC-type antimicrobial peptide transport system permease subunit